MVAAFVNEDLESIWQETFVAQASQPLSRHLSRRSEGSDPAEKWTDHILNRSPERYCLTQSLLDPFVKCTIQTLHLIQGGSNMTGTICV